MITITLPDASKREFEQPITVAQVAASIGAGLAKAALGGRVGQGDASRLVDISYLIEADESLAIVTDKGADGLEMIRHSTAHLLAYAVSGRQPRPWLLMVFGIAGFAVICWGAYQLWLLVAG